ncbi:hypothetical protein B0T10DRAFT_463454 [Thelonectria olida]|uniref:Uncharacterized protein n=1 Tax=Thelonectria olida TaxID=1576542 RepID=A0A9P8VXY9_9HYPO|nr:hypothetical protein B0T10DRAFT_463454 [Thelonectria olida]
MAPRASFHGPVDTTTFPVKAGSLSSNQLKCCGFIQCSTYLVPPRYRDPTFKGGQIHILADNAVLVGSSAIARPRRPGPLTNVKGLRIRSWPISLGFVDTLEQIRRDATNKHPQIWMLFRPGWEVSGIFQQRLLTDLDDARYPSNCGRRAAARL